MEVGKVEGEECGQRKGREERNGGEEEEEFSGGQEGDIMEPFLYKDD